MQNNTISVAKNIKEASQIAKKFLKKILKEKKGQKNALVVGLSGNLGVGKTTFTQAIGKHLGIKNKITSPTFVLIKKYSINLGKYKFFFHLDAYRLKDEKELLHLGWEEIINNKENIVFIEWPENVSVIIPKSSKYVYIKINEEGQRNLELK